MEAATASATLDELGPPSVATGQLPTYSIYGLAIQSDVPLPVDPVAARPENELDLVVRRRNSRLEPPDPDTPEATAMRCQHGTIAAVRKVDIGGEYVWTPGCGTFRISSDARRVDVHADERFDEPALGLVLVGLVLPLVLHRRGYLCLHASAVVTDVGAVAFVGPGGRGKSTMAACFLRRGATVLTDDVLPVRFQGDECYGTPSLPMMKVWRETAEHVLELPGDLPQLRAGTEKKLLSLDQDRVFAPAPSRLRAIYFIDRYEPMAVGRSDISIRPLSGRKAFTTLLAQTSISGLLSPTDAALLLPIYARLVSRVALRVLTCPSGFVHQSATYDAVMADLGRR